MNGCTEVSSIQFGRWISDEEHCEPIALSKENQEVGKERSDEIIYKKIFINALGNFATTDEHVDLTENLEPFVHVETKDGNAIGSLAIEGDIGFCCSLKVNFSATIIGNIGQSVSIEAQKIFVSGQFSPFCSLRASERVTIAGNYGCWSSLEAVGDIRINGTVKSFCTITSTIGNIFIKTIKDNVTLSAPKGKIYLEDAGNNANIVSGRGVFIKNGICNSIRISKPPFGDIFIAGVRYTNSLILK